jgi:hypothetical protein
MLIITSQNTLHSCLFAARALTPPPQAPDVAPRRKPTPGRAAWPTSAGAATLSWTSARSPWRPSWRRSWGGGLGFGGFYDSGRSRRWGSGRGHRRRGPSPHSQEPSLVPRNTWDGMFEDGLRVLHSEMVHRNRIKQDLRVTSGREDRW